MFARYAFKAGAVAADIVADICALMSGAAVSALSAACEKSISSVEGAAPEWRADDPGYGVISAPCLGSGRKVFRFVAVGKLLKCQAMESWNTTTHAGLNVCESGALSPSIDTASAGVLSIVATEDGAAVIDAAGRAVMLAEITNKTPMIGGRPSWIVIDPNSSPGGLVPRVKNYSSAGDTNAARAYLVMCWPNGSALRGDGEAMHYQMLDVFVSMVNSAVSCVVLGSLRGVKAVPSAARTLDVLVSGDGEKYTALNVSDSSSYMVGLRRG